MRNECPESAWDWLHFFLKLFWRNLGYDLAGEEMDFALDTAGKAGIVCDRAEARAISIRGKASNWHAKRLLAHALENKQPIL